MTNYQPKKKYLSQLRHHQNVPQRVLIEGNQNEHFIQQNLHHLQQSKIQHQQQLFQQNSQRINYASVESNTQLTEMPKNEDNTNLKANVSDNISPNSNHVSQNNDQISTISKNQSPSTSYSMTNLVNPNYNKEILNKLQQQSFTFNNTDNYPQCTNFSHHVNINKFSDSYSWSQQEQSNLINKNLQQQQQLFNRNLIQHQNYRPCDNNNNQQSSLQLIENTPHHQFMQQMHSVHQQNTISPCSTSDEMSILTIKEELQSNNNIIEENKFCFNNNIQHSQISPQYYNNSQGNSQDNSKNASNSDIKEAVSNQNQILQQLKPLLTSSGRNKGSGKPIEPKHLCQVCGDLAAGFHCGAYVCEACKVCFKEFLLCSL